MKSTPDTLTRELGSNIATRRRQLGLTQEQLAEMTGISHQSLSRIEHGRIAPKMDRLPDFAMSLQCAVSDLFKREDVSDTDTERRLIELMSDLPPDLKKYVLNHIASLVFIIRSR